MFISCRILTVVVDTAPDAAKFSEAFVASACVWFMHTDNVCRRCLVSAAAALITGVPDTGGPPAIHDIQLAKQRERHLLTPHCKKKAAYKQALEADGVDSAFVGTRGDHHASNFSVYGARPINVLYAAQVDHRRRHDAPPAHC